MKVNVRPVNSQYDFSREDAIELAAIVLMPRAERAGLLRRFANERGGVESLIWLFSDFIGLANSVESNARDFLDVAAIVDGKMHPHAVEQLNMPTILGALNGVSVAIDPVKGMCGGCAYRLGTHANQSICTTTDAKDALENPWVFKCHNDLDENGDPTTVCAGYEHCRAELEANVAEAAQ